MQNIRNFKGNRNNGIQKEKVFTIMFDKQQLIIWNITYQ